MEEADVVVARDGAQVFVDETSLDLIKGTTKSLL